MGKDVQDTLKENDVALEKTHKLTDEIRVRIQNDLASLYNTLACEATDAYFAQQHLKGQDLSNGASVARDLLEMVASREAWIEREW